MQDRDLVAVVDDNQVNRDIVRMMLEAVAIDVRDYSSAQAFLDAPHFRDVGCVVLDVRMPGMSGLELQRTLKDMKWPVPILFLSAHGDIAMAVEAMRCGAFGFMEKPFHDHELIERVQGALARWRRLREHERQRNAVRVRLASLTAREREVLELLAAGQRSKQIARNLSISVKTVEEHRANLLRKTGSASMLELVSLAAQHAAHSDIDDPANARY
jgi:two-component system, LuxR family, response regulator FixJ